MLAFLCIWLHFGSKKTVKISIVLEDLSRHSVFSNRSEALVMFVMYGEGGSLEILRSLKHGSSHEPMICLFFCPPPPFTLHFLIYSHIPLTPSTSSIITIFQPLTPRTNSLRRRLQLHGGNHPCVPCGWKVCGHEEENNSYGLSMASLLILQYSRITNNLKEEFNFC